MANCELVCRRYEQVPFKLDNPYVCVCVCVCVPVCL